MLSMNISPREAEQKFQEVLKDWSETGNVQSRDQIWLLIHNCCSNICKARLKGISIGTDRLYDRVMDATVLCCHYIFDNGKRPNKLSSFCFLPCIGVLYGKAAKKEDSEVSYDAQMELGNQVAVDILGNIIDEYKPKDFEDVRGICRKELMNTLD